MKVTKKQCIIIILFILLISSIIASSGIGRFQPTHMIVKQISCLSCHPEEFEKVKYGDHIRKMTLGQNKIFNDYISLYGNASKISNKVYSIEGPCYSCHITYSKFSLFGLTDPYVFRNAYDRFDSQYGYMIEWTAGNSPTTYFNNTNVSIRIELELLDVGPTNYTVDTTVKVALANYSGQQTGSVSFDSNAILSKGDTMVIDVTDMPEDYFKIILVLDGLWNNTLLSLRVNNTDKGSESFSIIADRYPFIYELPFNATSAYYFRTNGTYKAVRLDYILSEWKNYIMENITASELIQFSKGPSWSSGYTCSSPEGMCHIIQKATSIGLTDGMNPDNSLYAHYMESVTSVQCKLCHLRNSVLEGDCIGCHEVQQDIYEAVDTLSFTDHRNIDKSDGLDILTNRDCRSCHYDTSKMYRSGFTVSTRICTDCHGAGNFYSPLVAEHNQIGQEIITYSATCVSCHDNNGMMEKNSTNVAHYTKYVTDINTIPYQHFGPINTSNCIECHDGPYTEDPNWGSPTNIRTSTKRQHSETQTSECDLCHNNGGVQSLTLVDFHNASVKTGSGTSISGCLGCHQNQQGVYPAIDTTSFSIHKNVNTINGNDNLTNNDCQTCHYDTLNMMQPGFTVATRNCTDCHIQGSFSAPTVKNHIAGAISVTTVVYCSICHNNTINKYVYSENASIGHYTQYVTDTNTTPYQHFGPINTSNCIECHNGPYTNNVSWGSPIDISTSTKRQHNETQTNECDLCHNNGGVQSLTLVDFHNASVVSASGGTGLNCVICHTGIANSFFGKHKDISATEGTGVLSNNDCKECHFNITIENMQTGYANFSNTYFCQDCHVPNGRNPIQYINIINTTLRKTAMPPGHAQNRCKECHIAGDDEPKPLPIEYKYHTNGPAGTATGKNCFSCHYRSDGIGSGGANIGLNNKPFNAPGEEHNCLLCHGAKSGQINGRPTSCSMCHTSNNNHDVTIGNHDGVELTTISSPIVTSPVNIGDVATINTTVSSTFTQIAKAQYRVIDDNNNIIIDWSEMSAIDGKFDERIEDTTGMINTTGLLGNYTILVKGMSSAAKGAPVGGINHNQSRPYYPDNGVWTDIKVTVLAVK